MALQNDRHEKHRLSLEATTECVVQQQKLVSVYHLTSDVKS